MSQGPKDRAKIIPKIFEALTNLEKKAFIHDGFIDQTSLNDPKQAFNPALSRFKVFDCNPSTYERCPWIF